jgi:hypothetical protein
MPRYNPHQCEDDSDAARMAETILRNLGFVDVQRGRNVLDVRDEFSLDTLLNIARNAERIARWARKKATGK